MEVYFDNATRYNSKPSRKFKISTNSKYLTLDILLSEHGPENGLTFNKERMAALLDGRGIFFFDQMTIMDIGEEHGTENSPISIIDRIPIKYKNLCYNSDVEILKRCKGPLEFLHQVIPPSDREGELAYLADLPIDDAMSKQLFLSRILTDQLVFRNPIGLNPASSIISYTPTLTAATMRFVFRNPSPRDLDRFVKIIDAVHRVPGDLQQFIAVYAPSYSGKTQLAISLDQFTENPLYPRSDAISPDKRLLRACFRLPCSSAFEDREPGQTINASPLDPQLFKAAVVTDFRRIDDLPGPLESRVSVSSILAIFRKFPSETLGIFSAWIAARCDKSERQAFLNNGTLSPPKDATTITDFTNRNQISSSKPLVFVLDEYSLAEKDKQGHLLFLRNILRACGLVVIIMGTNSSALNMIDKDAIGSAESGYDPQLWAQVVTNIFSCSHIQQFYSPDQLKRSLRKQGMSDADIASIQQWLSKVKSVKPGAMKQLIAGLCSQGEGLSTAEVIWGALNYVANGFYTRKGKSERIVYLVGQVESLISTTQFANELQPIISSKLINEHYAFLVNYAEDRKVNLFSLYRKLGSSEDKSMWLYPLTWSPSNDDIRLVGLPVDNALSEGGGIYMENYLVGEFAEAVFPVILNPRSMFIPATGYPSYESDEIGYLGLFAGESFNMKYNDLREIGISRSQLGSIANLLDESNPGPQLSTRAAFTLAFRYRFSSEDPTVSNVEKSPKRDGFFPEIVSISAMVIASHKFGLVGLKFLSFLPEFVNELAWKKLPSVKLSDYSRNSLGAFANCMIPFIPMVRSTCSEALRSISGVNSGTVRMAMDKEEIGMIGYADCLRFTNPKASPERCVIITGEMKNCEDTVDYSHLKPIIEKSLTVAEALTLWLGKQRNDDSIRPKAHFHFVVVSRFANIQEGSWNSLAEEFPNLSVYVAVNFDKSNGELQLKCEVMGMQPTDIPSDQEKAPLKSRSRSFAAINARILNEQISRYKDETDTPAEIDENEVRIEVEYLPTCAIIIPVEDLLHNGPLQHTLPGDLVALATEKLSQVSISNSS